MRKSTYEKLTSLFPISPVCASQNPDSLGKNQILTYTSRIDLPGINSIVEYCTKESPLSNGDTDCVNWKQVIQRDSEGEKIKDDEGKTTRRWEPIHFLNNRKPGPTHIHLLTNRFLRTGYQPSLRKLVFSGDGQLLDGQHSLLAVWHLLNDHEVDYVDVSVEFNSKDDPETLFRLFDQAQRRRTLKDALTTVKGLPEKFEAELAGTLRFCTLLASGKGLDQSRLQLEHVRNEVGKLISLQPDDIAGFINSGEPFEYVHEFVHELVNLQVEIDEVTLPLISLPEISGSGMPNPQYYITAFLNALKDPRCTLDMTQIESFLNEIYLGAESDHVSIRKLVSYKPAKATLWLPAIERVLSCFLDKKHLKSMPKTLTFCGIATAYEEWLDTQTIEA